MTNHRAYKLTCLPDGQYLLEWEQRAGHSYEPRSRTTNRDNAMRWARVNGVLFYDAPLGTATLKLYAKKLREAGVQ
jgi:hypothetical protein